MLIAIPTTAGTGSEVTIASVVSNPKAKEKFAISDPKLVPQIALLDANLLKTLPPSIIADTGMDALTHAVEAFIGNALTKKTKSAALKAVRLIQNNLLEFYRNPDHEEAASNMLKASYYAGQAFTRSYVGYVHAIAHSLGGEYHVPHGRANAIILPHMLRRYGKKADKKLSLLAEAIKLTKDGERKETKALAFISWIDTLKEKLGIPKYFSHLIRKEDIPSLALRAAKEGNPLYPVPKELSQKELMAFYEEIDPYED
jgi:alcohol dehydrogenase class IV